MTDDSVLNPPVQRRSAETLRRIVQATRELLANREFDDITVDEIVSRAGSSKGSFYHRFPDKRALLIHLLQEEHRIAAEAWSELLRPESWTDRPLRDAVDAFLDRLMTIYRTRGPQMRAVAGEVFGRDGEVRALSNALNRHVLACLRAVFEVKRAEVDHPDPDAAARFMLTALIALLPALFLSPSQELFPEPISGDELEREVRRLTRRYLGVG